MLDKQCPLCGKPLKKQEKICKNCFENAHKRESINVVSDEENEQAEENIRNVAEPESGQKAEEKVVPLPAGNMPKKRSVNKYLAVVFFILLSCAGIIGGFFVFDKKKHSRHREELDFWYSCIEKNTPAVYSEYLFKYPHGRFSSEAYEKIGELREIESLEWEKIKNSKEINDYYLFLRTFPDTPFLNEAKKQIDSLSWEIATKENTPDAYRYYLENVESENITGFYESIARERYDYLNRISALSKNELETVKKTISSFFHALSRQEYKNLNVFFGKVIANFYGARNRTATAIISSIQADMDKNKIKSLVFEPDFKSLKSYKDGNGLIVTEITIEKKIAYRIKKKTETINETLHIDINSDMTIKALYVKGKEPEY
ncbi:MAG: zinc ribbon domain-containing protein [Prevotella sp.]|jgi:hypothetical protein|nr:zinc ribbon domain-containing protein [Prevotella sp.]